MADNTTIDPGAGGDTIRDKDRSGVKTPIIGLDLNIGGAETLMAGSMPITSADGAQVALGATSDASTATTVIGRLQKLVALLPAALGSGGGLKVDGSGTVLPVSPTAETAGVGVGAAADAAATGNGSLIGVVKQLRVLLSGGLPAALATGGGVKSDMTTIAGVAPSVSSGNKDTGTLRVTVATDQVALTNPLKVDPSGVTSPVSLAALPALVAGTALAGQVGAVPGMAQVIDSTGVARAVLTAFANVAASQTDSVIQALSGTKTTYVFAVVCVAGATATNITFNSKPSGAGAAISPLFANAANGGIVLPFTGSPWFQSASSAGISVTTGAGSTTGILILYAQY